MSAKMKIMVGYDGSPCAEAALNDLKRAGLSDETEALVVSVADVWLPTAEDLAVTGEMLPAGIHVARQHAIESDAEARKLADRAATRLRQWFPKWNVTAKSCDDGPAWGLLRVADEFKPNLLVVGSHGRRALGRMVLGSISQRVANDATCPVRLARGRFAEDVAPPRLVVGVDGSAHSETTVNSVAGRCWPAGTAVHVVAFVDLVAVALTSEFPPPTTWGAEDYASEQKRLEEFTGVAVAKLRETGLLAAAIVRQGDPRREIVHEAERWGADCVFVGAHGHTRLQKILGSVSQWVASRAHCSVELVR